MQSKKCTMKRHWGEENRLIYAIIEAQLEKLWYTGMLLSSTRIIETAWVIMLLFPWLRDAEESNSCSTVRWLHSIVSNEDHLCASTRFNRLKLELTTLSETRCIGACYTLLIRLTRRLFVKFTINVTLERFERENCLIAIYETKSNSLILVILKHLYCWGQLRLVHST